MDKKQVVKKIEEAGLYGKIVRHRDGTFTYKETFFYTFGKTAQYVADQVKKAIPEASILRAEEIWREWPTDSTFEVKFSIN